MNEPTTTETEVLPENEGLMSRLKELDAYAAAVKKVKKVSERATLVDALPAIVDAIKGMLIGSARELDLAERRHSEVLGANRKLLLDADKAAEREAALKQELAAAKAQIATQGRVITELTDSLNSLTEKLNHKTTSLVQRNGELMAARGDRDAALGAITRIAKTPWYALGAHKRIADNALADIL